MTANRSQATLDRIAPQMAERAVAAASAAATVLPSIEPLSAGSPQPGPANLVTAFPQADLAGAAVAELDGPLPAAVAVLVGAELVAALSGSPLGGLDLAAAVQPALDAAAAALGRRAGAARTVDLNLVLADLPGPYTAVPLAGSEVSAALLVSDSCLIRPPASAPSTAGSATGAVPRGIEMLHGVILDVTVELGRTRMTVRDLLALAPGTVLELDRAAGSPADLLVNGRIIARGEVVVVDEDFGLRVTEILEEPAAN